MLPIRSIFARLPFLGLLLEPQKMSHRIACAAVDARRPVRQGAHAQSFGVEVFNNLMPASGGMAGASIASPQDVQSAIYGNPATLTQYRGTQFGLGGAWIEPTYNLTVADPGLPLRRHIGPFANAKSDAQGIAAPNIGITQDFNAQGLPVTMGLGLMAGSGAGVDFRHVPASNGTHASFVALDIVAGAGVDLTDRLSLGASIVLSQATMDGPFVGITGSSTDYALRGSRRTRLRAASRHDRGHLLEIEGWLHLRKPRSSPASSPEPTSMSRPIVRNPGAWESRTRASWTGVCCWRVMRSTSSTPRRRCSENSSTTNGPCSSVLSTLLNDRVRLRLGYAWNENPMRDSVGDRVGGVLRPAAKIMSSTSRLCSPPSRKIALPAA